MTKRYDFWNVPADDGDDEYVSRRELATNRFFDKLEQQFDRQHPELSEHSDLVTSAAAQVIREHEGDAMAWIKADPGAFVEATARRVRQRISELAQLDQQAWGGGTDHDSGHPLTLGHASEAEDEDGYQPRRDLSRSQNEMRQRQKKAGLI